MNLRDLEILCETAAGFFARGLAFGSTGNLSLRDGNDVWITPTGASLRSVTPERLASIDLQGIPHNSNPPSKEYPFHLAAYRSAGARASALVHLHATYTVALSCLAGLDAEHPLPVMTPYYLMRVAPLAVIPYFRPGSPELAAAVGEAARDHDCMLLGNHGLVCLGRTMEEAADRAYELEETAKLAFLLHGRQTRVLTQDEQDDILRVFLQKAG
jgi:ribulose-5-phosphate 4-epimerase/fuculose-1-phosphate aldolase